MKYLHDYNSDFALLDKSYGIPEHIAHSFENYLIHGFSPGGFVTSILANDIFLAVGRADGINRQFIPQIVNWIIFNMPPESIGSYQAIEDWCNDKNNIRSNYAYRLKQHKFYEALTT
jgi:hypothetical protein